MAVALLREAPPQIVQRQHDTTTANPSDGFRRPNYNDHLTGAAAEDIVPRKTRMAAPVKYSDLFRLAHFSDRILPAFSPWLGNPVRVIRSHKQHGQLWSPGR
jgi:hypothetical protein